MPCVNGQTRVQMIIYAQKIGTIMLLEKVQTRRFCRAGDPGSISKIPKKKKADVKGLDQSYVEFYGHHPSFYNASDKINIIPVFTEI